MFYEPFPELKYPDFISTINYNYMLFIKKRHSILSIVTTIIFIIGVCIDRHIYNNKVKKTKKCQSY